MKIAKRLLLVVALALVVAAGAVTAETEARLIAGDDIRADTNAKRGYRYMWDCHVEAWGPFNEGYIRGTGIIECSQNKWLRLWVCVQWFDDAYNTYVDVACTFHEDVSTRYITRYAWAQCVTGRYRVRAWGDARFPDGSNPEYPPGATTSPAWINC